MNSPFEKNEIPTTVVEAFEKTLEAIANNNVMSLEAIDNTVRGWMVTPDEERSLNFAMDHAWKIFDR